MTADEVVPNLWVGSAPLPADIEFLNTFDTVVFAADTYQPDLIRGFRKTAIRCGIDDHQITEVEKRRVLECAKMVADRLFRGQKVLCTCISGWNRSSLVAALAMKLITPYSTEEIIDLIRAARGDSALSNWSFVGFLGEQSPF
jgi:protein-tyrosine phosphatase